MSHDRIDAKRRRLLLGSAGLPLAGLLPASLALQLAGVGQASAQTAGDYKAVICLFLGGGDDSLNTFPPLDAASNTSYRASRSTLALSQGVLPLQSDNSPGGRRLGLHPELAGLAPIFEAGRMAVVGSVGTLIEPVTRAQLEAGQARVPENLFSHTQDTTWLSVRSGPNLRGWGGRLADHLQGLNAHPATTAITLSYIRTLLVGNSVSPFSVGIDGGVRSVASSGEWLDQVSALAPTRTNLLEKSVARTYDRLRDGAAVITNSIVPSSQVPALPPNPNQVTVALRTVLRMVMGRAASSTRRQVFFVGGPGGYDTHADQLNTHRILQRDLAQALTWFDGALQSLGVAQNVALFTASEFGRNLVQNGDGTDHGWGAHHLVMGGAVNGRAIYGHLPDLNRSGPDLWGGNAIIPRVPVEQLAGSFGRWMGLNDAQLRSALPNLANFSSLVVPGPQPLLRP